MVTKKTKFIEQFMSILTDELNDNLPQSASPTHMLLKSQSITNNYISHIVSRIYEVMREN